MKHPCSKVMVLIAIILSVPLTVQCQWIKTNGPYGGSVHAVAASNSSVYVGTWGAGVFASTNNGAEWKVSSNGLTSLYISSLAVIESNIIAGTYSGIFLSTDNGKSWQSVSTGIKEDVVNAIVVSNTYMFAATASSLGDMGRVYRSTDNGVSWSVFATGLPNIAIHALYCKDTTLYAGTDSGIYSTSTNSDNWKSSGLLTKRVNAIISSASNLLAGVGDRDNQAVYYSTNKGTDWIKSELQNAYVWSFAALGSSLYVGTDIGVLRSDNNGSSWTAINSGLLNTFIYTLSASNNNLYAGTLGGVFISTNNGTHWQAINIGLPSIVYSMLATNTTLLAGTEGGVFTTSDNGDNWNVKNTGLTSTIVRTLAASQTHLFAGVINGGVFTSTDKGLHWIPVNTGLIDKYVRALLVSGDNDYVGTNDGIFRSADNGANWEYTGLKLRYPVALSESGGSIYAGTLNGVFRSTDNGMNWETLQNWLTNTILASGTNVYVATYNAGVFRSTNFGLDWIAVNNGLTSLNVQSLIESDSYLFAGTGDGVFVSTNKGVLWRNASSGLPLSTTILSLSTLGSELYAGTLNGVWKRPISEMITSVDGSGAGNDDSNFHLIPNPAGEFLKVQYVSECNGHVHLDLIDNIGRIVYSSEPQLTSNGVFSTELNVTSFPQGAYRCVINDTGKIVAKLIQIIR